MQLKKHKQVKNKTRDDYKKEKWGEVGQYSNSSLDLSTKQPDENKQKVFYKGKFKNVSKYRWAKKIAYR